MHTSATYLRPRGILLLACVFFVAVFIAGCGADSGTPVVGPVVPPVVPADPDLSTPESAVRSYTDWISYAYRVQDSDVATHAFSEWEEVRVNSYVQYNKLESRAIEQMLQRSAYERVRSSDSTVTLVGSEYWLYRYMAPDESKYLTGPLEASYDVTYTVVFVKDKGWLVDKVEVDSTEEVR